MRRPLPGTELTYVDVGLREESDMTERTTDREALADAQQAGYDAVEAQRETHSVGDGCEPPHPPITAPPHERLRDDEFDTSRGFETMWAKADVEQRDREEREAKAATAKALAYEALPETDHERDAAHDSGEDEWRNE